MFCRFVRGYGPVSYTHLYHTSRHTFATMMLTLGADLYTVSKLLGHADVKMTQVYACLLYTSARKKDRPRMPPSFAESGNIDRQEQKNRSHLQR